MKSTKKSLIASALSLVLCVSMLLGTTYAWFTDSVTSGKNKIIAGNLDVELTHTNAKVTNQKVQDATDLFGVALWEPGVIAWENFTVTNVGNLALKYALNLNVFDKNATTEGHDLTEVIKVAVIDGGFTATGDPVADRASAQAITTYESLKDFQKTGNLAGGDSTGDTFGVVLYWQPTDNDNLYNLKNGLTSTDGQPLFVEFGVNLVATQDTVEADSFDKYYDKSATFPNIPAVGTKATKTENVPADTTKGMTIKNDLATIEIPAGNIDDDASKYRLDVERIENIAEGQTGAVTLTSDIDTLVSYDVTLVEIKADNSETKVSSEQAQEYTVTLYVGTHCELIKLYHKGTPITNFTYNAANGKVTYKTKSFSPYAAEIKYAGGEGTEEHPYLVETLEQFVGIKQNMDKSFMLISDIDATDRDWAPLGYGHYKKVGNSIQLVLDDSDYFVGAFDGNHHTIKYKYNSATASYAQTGTFKDISLFGIIWGGSVSNLTLDVDINITEKGVAGSGIAYQALGTFENITVNGKINSTSSSAGLVYAASYSQFKNCTNNADINVTYMYTNAEKSGDAYQLVGGIAGDVASGFDNDPMWDAVFTNCKNTGNLTNKTVTDRQPRSIMGAMYAQAVNSTTTKITMTNCTNTGVFTGYEASNVNPNAYPYPMFEGVKNSGGNTYAGKANVLKQLVGGYSAAGVSVNGVVYDKNTNTDALSIGGNMVMFKPGTAE